jgi:hypothetical protein
MNCRNISEGPTPKSTSPCSGSELVPGNPVVGLADETLQAAEDRWGPAVRSPERAPERATDPLSPRGAEEQAGIIRARTGTEIQAPVGILLNDTLGQGMALQMGAPFLFGQGRHP